MGLWQTSDELGRHAEEKRIEKNQQQEAAEKAKAEAAEKERQHEENKKQGMI